MNLNSVRTPEDIEFVASTTFKEVEQSLNAEFKSKKCWSDVCSNLLKENALCLFSYDRFEYGLGNAFGSHSLKIAVNPLMIQCYHPYCIDNCKSLIKLRHMFDLSSYLYHLSDHLDPIGSAMRIRFGAISENLLTSEDDLDNLSVSPFHLIQPLPLLKDKTVINLQSYGINRHIRLSYICYWKDLLIKKKKVNSSSISFQEDDALVQLVLSYPNPIRDWSFWRSIFYYGLKLYTSISSTALTLFRGTTNYNRLSGTNSIPNLKHFVSEINHPCPSVTSLQRFLPRCSYENNVFHKSQTLFHLKLLEKQPNSIKFNFDHVIRYPVTLGVDEQEINQGTFIENGVLHGLSNKMNCAELRDVGLENLRQHISEVNHFVTAVREYRLTDLSGSLCSNIYTSFLHSNLNSDIITSSLQHVVGLAKSCSNCLMNGDKCSYKQISDRCNNCIIKNSSCVSLVVVNVLWDMGSYHKKASNTMKKMDCVSTDDEFLDSDLFSISFGGLHLAKCFVNSIRNHVLSYDGQNFGVHILRAIKNGDDRPSELLSNIKNAVFVGKDRQSDYTAYMTCCEKVQHALEVKKVYNVIRIPESILTYADNVKTQKDYIFPTAVRSNSNGDIFILDSGASCIHVTDRSIVAKVSLIGKFKMPDLSSYKQSKISSKDIKFSNCLSDMIVVDDNVYVCDQQRNEVILIQNCHSAKQVLTCKSYILQITGLKSLSFLKDMLVVLRETEDGLIINTLDITLPKRSAEIINLCFEIKSSFKPTVEISSLFVINFSQNYFGSFSTTGQVHFFKARKKNFDMIDSGVKSCINPATSQNGMIIGKSNDIVIHFSVTIKGDDVLLDSSREIVLESAPFHLNHWGKVIHVIRKLNYSYVLEEVGPLEFGIDYCKAIEKFYDSITYVPPYGDQSVRKFTILECIENAQHLVKLLTSMQTASEARFPSTKSFMGHHGMPFTASIKCLVDTVESWKACVKRIDYIDPNLSKHIYPHTLTNESIIEHSFGFVMRKGQGHLQNMQEYTQAKNKHAIDFQFRMCNVPFNQSVKVKLRDKGYQHLPKHFNSKLEVKDLLDLFKSCEGEQAVENKSLNSDDETLLKRAFLVSKSVPRRTSRAKWKESSGYQPNMLSNKNISGKLLKDDLVICKDFSENMIFLKVHDADLIGKDISVAPICLDSEKTTISTEKLLTYKGFIFTIPSSMYTIVDGKVLLSDLIEEVYQEVLDNHSVSEFDDFELALLNNTVESENCKGQTSTGEQPELTATEINVEEGSSLKRSIGKETKKRSNKKRRKCALTSVDDKTDIMHELRNVWSSITPPVSEKTLIDKWFACIYKRNEVESKNRASKPQLIIGRLKNRFLSDENGPVDKVRIECLKPYDLSSEKNIVEEYQIDEDIWDFNLHDIIAGPLDLTYIKANKWEIHDIEKIIDVFNCCIRLDRADILSSS